MCEVARDSIHLVAFAVGYGVVFGGAVLVQRAKRGSPRWQQRSERQSRLLARIPGLVIAVVLYAMLLVAVPI